jgi:hypothetical protein
LVSVIELKLYLKDLFFLKVVNARNSETNSSLGNILDVKNTASSSRRFDDAISPGKTSGFPVVLAKIKLDCELFATFATNSQ